MLFEQLCIIFQNVTLFYCQCLLLVNLKKDFKHCTLKHCFIMKDNVRFIKDMLLIATTFQLDQITYVVVTS